MRQADDVVGSVPSEALANAQAKVVAQRKVMAALAPTDRKRPEQQALLDQMVQNAFLIETNDMLSAGNVQFICRQPPDPDVLKAIADGMAGSGQARSPKRRA